MTLFIQRSAREDILRQYRYYLDIEPDGLADRFLAAARDAIDRIETNPHAGSPRYFANSALAGLRSMTIEGFGHFRVYYMTRNDIITIIRVLNNRRDLGAIFKSEGIDEPEVE